MLRMYSNFEVYRSASRSTYQEFVHAVITGFIGPIKGRYRASQGSIKGSRGSQCFPKFGLRPVFLEFLLWVKDLALQTSKIAFHVTFPAQGWSPNSRHRRSA